MLIVVDQLFTQLIQKNCCYNVISFVTSSIIFMTNGGFPRRFWWQDKSKHMKSSVINGHDSHKNTDYLGRQHISCFIELKRVKYLCPKEFWGPELTNNQQKTPNQRETNSEVVNILLTFAMENVSEIESFLPYFNTKMSKQSRKARFSFDLRTLVWFQPR